MDADAPAIEARSLSKRYGPVAAVDALSFAVPRGSVTGFLGPNGAGKTTTMRLMLGLAAPTSGTATILGVPYAKLDEPLRRVGAALEITGFHPGRTARDHLRITCVEGGLAEERADAVLAMTGMGGSAEREGPDVLLRDAAAARTRDRAARRADRPDPRRAGERPRPGGRGVVA